MKAGAAPPRTAPTQPGTARKTKLSERASTVKARARPRAASEGDDVRGAAEPAPPTGETANTTADAPEATAAADAGEKNTPEAPAPETAPESPPDPGSPPASAPPPVKVDVRYRNGPIIVNANSGGGFPAYGMATLNVTERFPQPQPSGFGVARRARRKKVETHRNVASYAPASPKRVACVAPGLALLSPNASNKTLKELSGQIRSFSSLGHKPVDRSASPRAPDPVLDAKVCRGSPPLASTKQIVPSPPETLELTCHPSPPAVSRHQVGVCELPPGAGRVVRTAVR